MLKQPQVGFLLSFSQGVKILAFEGKYYFICKYKRYLYNMYLLSCNSKSNKLNHFVRKEPEKMKKWNPKLKLELKFIIIMKVMIFKIVISGISK